MRRPRAKFAPCGARLAALLSTGLAVVALPVTGAEPGSAFPQLGARVVQVRHAAMTLDQAIEMAERRFHARVVRAGVEESAGQRTYVLRLINEQGRVWTVRVDAQSGQIL